MGAEFIAEKGVLKGLILSLERGEEWTIGRDPDLSAIVIEDPKASRIHLRIHKTEKGYVAENLSDSNPALVNGKALSESTLLHEGDLVTIGGSAFRFYPEGAAGDQFAFEVESDNDEAAEESEEKEEAPREEFAAEEASAFEQGPEEDVFEEELFEESEIPELEIDLTPSTRFILKVIAGPNTGAEFALDLDRSYLIGTDTSTCDIVFNDLSVSREHARLSVSKEGKITLEDLGSRNGVIVDKERIVSPKTLSANSVAALGTSAFLLIDREAPSETIAAPLFEAPPEEKEEAEVVMAEEVAAGGAPAAVQALPKRHFPIGTFILSLFVCGLAVLLGIGLVSLFQTKEVEVARKDRLAELQGVLKNYPAVRFTYNPKTEKIFLVGHVRTGVEHNELLYQLKALSFLTGIDDNVVNDEAVWQEMNILLSKHPDFKGVSMHSPEPGVFVISGFLQTEKQASDLTDYLNVNFNYLDRLQYRIVVEQAVVEDVMSRLTQQGFAAVNATLSNGELQLTGYVNSTELFAFEKLIEEFKKIPGVRNVRNFVVAVTPELSVIDLNRKYATKDNIPRYRVTGYSTHGDININVVINGQILGRGDCLDGYTITSIQPNIIFLEKDGLKYKLEYNKCKSFAVEE